MHILYFVLDLTHILHLVSVYLRVCIDILAAFDVMNDWALTFDRQSVSHYALNLKKYSIFKIENGSWTLCFGIFAPKISFKAFHGFFFQANIKSWRCIEYHLTVAAIALDECVALANELDTFAHRESQKRAAFFDCEITQTFLQRFLRFLYQWKHE